MTLSLCLALSPSLSFFLFLFLLLSPSLSLSITITVSVSVSSLSLSLSLFLFLILFLFLSLSLCLCLCHCLITFSVSFAVLSYKSHATSAHVRLAISSGRSARGATIQPTHGISAPGQTAGQQSSRKSLLTYDKDIIVWHIYISAPADADCQAVISGSTRNGSNTPPVRR